MKFGNLIRIALITTVMASAFAGTAAAQGGGMQAPQLANQAELATAFREHYNLQLRRQGIGGSAQVRLFIDTNGRPDTVRLATQTGHAELDSAVVRIVQAMRFTPAMVDNQPRALWLDLPITLQPPERIDPRGMRRIKLANRAEILETLRANLPTEALEAEKLVLQADLWVELDPNGQVVDIDFQRSTCVEDTDRLAYYLGHGLKFERLPGYDGPMNGWTVVTLTFDPFTIEESHVELERDAEIRKAVELATSAAQLGALVQPPEVQNKRELELLARLAHPDELVAQGVGGTTEVTVWVDERGNPYKRMISKSSNNCQLDMIALDVMTSAKFNRPRRESGPSREVVTHQVEFKVRGN